MRILINIDVPDLGSAIAFYERAVGLRLGRLLFSDTVAEMRGTASPIYLTVKAPGRAASASAARRRDYHRHWTPVHLDFVVEDVERAVRTAQAAGAMIEGDIQSFSWGKLATMSDPFGHGFCFLQFAGNGYGEAGA